MRIPSVSASTQVTFERVTTVATDHRTLRSAPLHLAHHADRDHPDFGSHDPGDGDAGDDELEEELP